MKYPSTAFGQPEFTLPPSLCTYTVCPKRPIMSERSGAYP